MDARWGTRLCPCFVRASPGQNGTVVPRLDDTGKGGRDA
jgi:hypothetical protein